MKTFQKPLSKEEESLCIQALQAEDAGRKSEAKRLLIERNLRLVAHIAKKYSSEEELEDLIIHKAWLWLDSGKIFGKAGEGFQRINVACPRVTLTEALKRIQNAVKESD